MDYNSYNLKNSENFIKLYNELALLNKSSSRKKKKKICLMKMV